MPLTLTGDATHYPATVDVPTTGDPRNAENSIGAPVQALLDRTSYLKSHLDLGLMATAPGGFDPAVDPLAADHGRMVLKANAGAAPDQLYLAIQIDAAPTYRWAPMLQL